MFVNIAIVAVKGSGLELIRASVRNQLRYTVKEFLSLNEVNQSLSQFSFDILIARYPRVDSRVLNLILALQARFPKRFLLVVSPQIDPEIRYHFRETSRVVLLHEKFEARDLARIIDAVSKGSSHPGRLHVRSVRDEAAKLLNSENGQAVSARLLDLAQMGARVIVPTFSVVENVRRVQLHYASRSEPGKIHRIEAKVIWTETSSGWISSLLGGPEQQLGLRFIAAL